MPSRDVVRVLAIGRIALGVAMLVAPRRAASAWIGPAGDTAGASVLARALGIRDAVFGGMLLHTLSHPPVARRWTATCGVCDVVDGSAAWAARSSLPPVRGRLGALFALGAGVAHFALAPPLDEPDPPADNPGVAVDPSSDAATAPPTPASPPEREVVMPDGAEEAKRMMGARTIGVDVHHGHGATQGNRSQPGGLQQ